jgi:hypothetical protein
VLEGDVRMSGHGGEMASVEGGTRRLIFSDGHDEHGDMRPMERQKLGMFREQVDRGT